MDAGRREMSSSGLRLCRLDFGINFLNESFAELAIVAGHWLGEDLGRSTSLSMLSRPAVQSLKFEDSYDEGS